MNNKYLFINNTKESREQSTLIVGKSRMDPSGFLSELSNSFSSFICPNLKILET